MLGHECDLKHNFAAAARLCFESGPATLCFQLTVAGLCFQLVVEHRPYCLIILSQKAFSPKAGVYSPLNVQLL